MCWLCNKTIRWFYCRWLVHINPNPLLYMAAFVCVSWLLTHLITLCWQLGLKLSLSSKDILLCSHFILREKRIKLIPIFQGKNLSPQWFLDPDLKLVVGHPKGITSHQVLFLFYGFSSYSYWILLLL